MKHFFRFMLLLCSLCCLSITTPDAWADGPDITEKTTAAVTDAAKATAETVESWWDHFDEYRLVNRTRDEVIAWVFLGVLVGAVAGLTTQLKPSGIGKLGRLLLGLGGAFIGGMTVRMAAIDLGWGFAIISYEELLFSFIGAILLIVVGRFVGGAGMAKKEKPPLS